MNRSKGFKRQCLSALRNTVWMALLISGSCTGTVISSERGKRSEDRATGGQREGGDGGGGQSTGSGTSLRLRLSDPKAYGVTGPRRLTRHEYRSTVNDLFGVDIIGSLDVLPTDSSNPFDNDYTQQAGSSAWTEGAKALADRVTAQVLADPAARARVIGCTPSVVDNKCLRAMTTSLGKRVLRRPLLSAEIERYVAAAHKVAVAQNNPDAGISIVVRALLQDMEFLNRIEIGVPVEGDDGARRLTNHEIATRLSYFLWGSTPSDDLLVRADRNELQSASQVREAASALLASPRARVQIERFHSQWLGYETLPHSPALSASLRRETDALIGKVIFEEQRPWLDLFKSSETYIDDALATRYGLSRPGERAWVSYGNSGRRGILSHGSILSNGGKFGDTSPVGRGLYVLRRLLCQEIPSPPAELQVDTDEAPQGKDPNACKAERYSMHSEGGCANCHQHIDGIGFGLENYDQTGAYRTTEPGRPDCPIEGKGEVVDVGAFSGPAELGDKLLASGAVEACFLNHLFQSMAGRPVSVGDGPAREALADIFVKNGHRFDLLLLDLVSSEAFRNRSNEGALQ
jgi:Protein of unknown function (DUF1592)/Protein of unknown function (DUF1588)/Protein of unknown function (DUF1587)/Protein of unknown function (DUF1585)/Protein of unknown function (DUF1595)